MDPSLLAMQAAQRYPLPNVFLELLALDESQPLAEAQLERVITSSPLLSSRIRALAETTDAPWSARQGQDLREGIRGLGLRRVHSASLLVALLDAIPAPTTVLDFLEFWRYSVATAFMTTSVAYHREVPERQLAFAAGLLHDVGRLVVDAELPSALARVRDEVRRARRHPWEAEDAVLGFPVLDLTVPLLQAWGLPTELVAGVDGLRGDGPALATALWTGIRVAKTLPCVTGRVAVGTLDAESAALMTRHFGGVPGLCERVDALLGAATLAAGLG